MPNQPRAAGAKPDTALVLGGGNALGSYLAGAYEILHQHEIQPSWVVGASIGAVTGAIIVGNAPEDRVGKLKEFWAEAMMHTSASFSHASKLRQTYNGVHSALATVVGRPTIFGPRFPGLLSILPWMPNDVALYDHHPLRATLERLVDFDRLNRGDVRFSVACVDLESGDEVFFDTSRDRIGPDHVLASSAITPAFPPVEVGGRLLCDPGYTNNVPLDYVLAEPPGRDLLCIALELYSLRSPRPASLDAILERTHDIVFASATRRSVAALRREYALWDKLQPDHPSATLLHVAYQSAQDELSLKSFDFSPSSIRERWAFGQRDMTRGLARLAEAGRQGGLTYVTIDPVDPDPAGIKPARFDSFDDLPSDGRAGQPVQAHP